MHKTTQTARIDACRLDKDCAIHLVRNMINSLIEKDCEIVCEKMVMGSIEIDMLFKNGSGRFIAIKVIDGSTDRRKLVALYNNLASEVSSDLLLYVLKIDGKPLMIEHPKIRSVGLGLHVILESFTSSEPVGSA